MKDTEKYFRKLARKSLKNIEKSEHEAIQERLMSCISIIHPQDMAMVDTLAYFMARAYLDNKNLFYTLFPFLIDFLRNNPSIPILERMLKVKGFNTAHMSSIFMHLVDAGVFSVFDLKNFIPARSPATTKIALLSKLLKKAPAGVMQDVCLEALVETIMPASISQPTPESMMSPSFLGDMLGTAQILVMLHRKGYPVDLVFQKMGEIHGPQMVLMIMMMFPQVGMKEQEVQELLSKLDNPAFQQMYEQAKRMMDKMLPQGASRDMMQEGMFSGMVGGSNMARNPLLKKLYSRLFKLFGRFGRF
ncbi:hypothetical protein GF325_08335 [Candidatus Bathyarchaeota archaeon]|nr:hypothetical protein [Candidatus Bathyarchaeota archaeon]